MARVLESELFIPTTGSSESLSESKIHWIKQNAHVCLLPFMVHGVSIEFDGQRDPRQQRTMFRNSCCCNLITTDQPDDQEIAHGLIQDVQQVMRQGLTHQACKRCADSERTIGSSERTLNLISTSPSSIQRLIDTGEIANFDFRIKFSNICNLACRSCSPTYSSKYSQVHGITVPHQLSQDLSEDPVLWQGIVTAIEQYLDQHDRVTLGLFGGESMIQPGALKLIEYLDSNRLSHRVHLDFTTNLTTMPDRMLQALPNFSGVNIKASLDSVGENFEYVRWPARWHTIERNLHTLFSHDRYAAVKLYIQPLFNLNNIFYLLDFLDFWQDWGQKWPDRRFTFSSLMMHRPAHMILQNLPLRYRPMLLHTLETAMTHPLLVQKHAALLRHQLEGMCNLAANDNDPLGQFELYLYESARLDRNYGTNMQQGNRKFFEILSPDDQTMYLDFLSNTRQLHPEQEKIRFSLPL